MTERVVGFWIALAGGWLVLTVGLFMRRRLALLASRRLSSSQACLIIVGVATLLRIVCVPATQPALSDDIRRYIHDGRTIVELGQSPYAEAPADSPLEYRGNYPELISIYQPTSQYVFAALAWISPDVDSFRLGFLGFDLIIIGLTLAWLTRRGLSPWWATLYAWHPLVITEVAWSGHQDVIGIAMLLGSAFLVRSMESSSSTGDFEPTQGSAAEPRRLPATNDARALGLAVGSGALFAAAVAVKPIVLPLALPWARAFGRRLVPLGLATIATLVALAGLYLPLALAEPGLSGMFDTVDQFTRWWWFNGSAHSAARAVLGGKPGADWLMAGVLGGVVIGLTWAKFERIKAAAIYLLAALLVSSTVHPWYLLWALAFVPLAFSPTTWVWSLTIGLAYSAWISQQRGGEFEVPTTIRWIEYLPVYAALVIESGRRWKSDHRRGDSKSNREHPGNESRSLTLDP